MDDPGQLSKEVYQSEAFQIDLRFEILATNYFIFERNYEEMKRLLSAMEHPDAFDKLWTRNKQQEMNVALREIIRLLHNLVASATTLVNHTRMLIRKWYAGTEFLEEYQLEVDKRFKGNPTTGFIEDFRNYALHFRLPATTAKAEVVSDPDTSEQTIVLTILLEKQDLLQWSNWTDKGKFYLKDAEDKIKLTEVIDQYSQEIRSFHIWMRNRLVDIHSDELKWLDEMNQRIQMSAERFRRATQQSYSRD